MLVEHDGALELVAILPDEHEIEVTYTRYLTGQVTIHAA